MDSLMKKVIGGFAALAVFACLCTHFAPPKASAFEERDLVGHPEHVVSASQATASAALIDTALSPGRLAVQSATIAGGTSGNYTFFSGSTVTGANQIGQFYLVANTPLVLPSDFFRGGMTTANDQGIYCVGAGTLTYTMVVRVKPDQTP